MDKKLIKKNEIGIKKLTKKNFFTFFDKKTQMFSKFKTSESLTEKEVQCLGLANGFLISKKDEMTGLYTICSRERNELKKINAGNQLRAIQKFKEVAEKGVLEAKRIPGNKIFIYNRIKELKRKISEYKEKLKVCEKELKKKQKEMIAG